MKYPYFSCIWIILQLSQISLKSNALDQVGGLTKDDVKFPQINYLGMGYDIVKGNPFPPKGSPSNEVFDPGFQGGRSIVEMKDYSEGKQLDNKWRIPNNVDGIISTGACSYETSFHEVADSNSYQNVFSGDISMESGANLYLVEAKFSASYGYQSSQNKLSSEERTHLYALSKCGVYRASLPSMISNSFCEEDDDVAKALSLHQAPFRLEDNFINTVRSLPREVNPRTKPIFQKFVESYGTHYTSSITMGGKAAYVMEFDKKSYSEMKANGYDVETSAKLKLQIPLPLLNSLNIGGEAEVKAGVHSKTEELKTFSESIKNEYRICIGARGQCPDPTSGEAANAWATIVKENPLPISYTLNDIPSLLTKTFFPQDPMISEKREALTNYLTYEYCEDLPGCSPPALDGYWNNIRDLSCEGYQNYKSITGMKASTNTFENSDRNIYLTGGKAENAGKQITDLQESCVYNPDTNTWSALPTLMDDGRYAHGSAILPNPKSSSGSLLFVIGGRKGTKRKSALSSNAEPILETVIDNYHTDWIRSVAISSDNEYIVSGSDDKTIQTWALFREEEDNQDLQLVRTVEYFDFIDKKWYEASPLVEPRYAHTTTVLDRQTVFVLGGVNGYGEVLGSWEIYNAKQNQWKSHQSNLVTPRYDHATAITSFDDENKAKRKICVFGGKDKKGRVLESIECFDAKSEKWRIVNNMEAGPRYGHSVQVLGKAGDPNQIFMIYGGNNGKSAERSTEYWTTTSLQFVQYGAMMKEGHSEIVDAMIPYEDRSTIYAIGSDEESYSSYALTKPQENKLL